MIDVLMIVKNEYEGVQVTLNSLVKFNFPGRVFILDTGSTDGTQEIVKSFQNLSVFVAEDEFKNFAQARNAAQNWVLKEFPDVEHVLWLDANDEISGAVPIVNSDAVHVCQEWSGSTRFFNLRIFRLQPNTIWHGYVHEWIELPPHFKTVKWDFETFVIRQDRSKNCQSSEKRWRRDIEMLHDQIKENPRDSRYYFYLGRTYKDIGDDENAKKYFRQRLDFSDFKEERFWAKQFIAEIEKTDPMLFMDAFEECGRIEPLLCAAQIYIDQHKWHLAFMCCFTATQYDLPKDCVLFINVDDYEYKRWHLLGIVAYYVGMMKIGKEACIKAGRDIDLKNLKWYVGR